jgi:hypothetical protein
MIRTSAFTLKTATVTVHFFSRHRSSVTGHWSLGRRPLLSALCPLLSALCPLPSALCPLLSALCPLLSALRSSPQKKQGAKPPAIKFFLFLSPSFGGVRGGLMKF